jgi:hypothetical protein
MFRNESKHKRFLTLRPAKYWIRYEIHPKHWGCNYALDGWASHMTDEYEGVAEKRTCKYAYIYIYIYIYIYTHTHTHTHTHTQGIPLKCIPTTITHYGTKMKSHPREIDSPNLLCDTQIEVTQLLHRCSQQLCKSGAGANMVYSWAEYVFMLKHYFVSISSAAVHEAFSNAYPDK